MAGGCVFYLEPRIDDAPKAVTHVIRGELLVGDAGGRGRKLGQQVAHGGRRAVAARRSNLGTMSPKSWEKKRKY